MSIGWTSIGPGVVYIPRNVEIFSVVTTGFIFNVDRVHVGKSFEVIFIPRTDHTYRLYFYRSTKVVDFSDPRNLTVTIHPQVKMDIYYMTLDTSRHINSTVLLGSNPDFVPVEFTRGRIQVTRLEESKLIITGIAE